MTKPSQSQMPHHRVKRALPMCVITEADPVDGLLTLASLAKPISLSFATWNEAIKGDSYKLSWNGVTTGAKKFIDTEKPGDPLYVDIPPALLTADGVYQVGYAATNGFGGQTSFSDEVPLIVDRTPPGGDLLAPLIFDPQQFPLTEESLSAAANVLTARLPSYYDAKWGDVVRTYWGEQPGPERTLNAEELGGSDITFTFERSFLEQLKDGDIPVTYTVTDRAGNVSKVSEPALLRLQLRNHPQNLLAPVVPQAADGMIEHNDARHGVQVQIPHYSNAQAGDVTILNWGGLALPGQVLSEPAAQQGVVLSIEVPFATVQAAGDGVVEVRYEVHRDGVPQATSPATSINVFVTLPGPRDPTPETPVNEQLVAPTVRGRSHHANQEVNFLDEDDYLLDADVVIPWQPAFSTCDQVKLYWGSWPLPVVRTLNQNDVDAGADLVICMPNKVIAGEGVGRAIPVHYRVTHAGNPNTSQSPTLMVRVVCKAQLPGGGCGLPGALFIDADDTHTLRLAPAPTGTLVRIKPYRNMALGDRIELQLIGFNAFIDGEIIEAVSHRLVNTVNEQQLVSDIDFIIPAKLLEAFSTGRIEAIYEITNDYGSAASLKSDIYIDKRPLQNLCMQ